MIYQLHKVEKLRRVQEGEEKGKEKKRKEKKEQRRKRNCQEIEGKIYLYFRNYPNPKNFSHVRSISLSIIGHLF